MFMLASISIVLTLMDGIYKQTSLTAAKSEFCWHRRGVNENKVTDLAYWFGEQ